LMWLISRTNWLHGQTQWSQGLHSWKINFTQGFRVMNQGCTLASDLSFEQHMANWG
jgi:hypothetical protein